VVGAKKMATIFAKCAIDQGIQILKLNAVI